MRNGVRKFFGINREEGPAYRFEVGIDNLEAFHASVALAWLVDQQTIPKFQRYWGTTTRQRRTADEVIDSCIRRFDGGDQWDDLVNEILPLQQRFLSAKLWREIQATNEWDQFSSAVAEGLLGVTRSSVINGSGPEKLRRAFKLSYENQPCAVHEDRVHQIFEDLKPIIERISGVVAAVSSRVAE